MNIIRNDYIDPLFLEKITYIDSEGKRRVRNPYRNRKSYGIIVPSVNEEGNFVFKVPDGVAGKSVFIEFPGKKIYSFTVNASTNEVTVIGIPPLTYIEINVVNPNPLPPSKDDLYWDELNYDAQKAIVAAWGDIDLICNVLYPSTVESELDFDDQNTIKYGLIAFKNNCGNLKSVDWERPKAPPNGIYFPPQPEPTPPQPTDPDIEHEYDMKFVLRWESNTFTDLDFHAYLNKDASKCVYYGSKTYGSGSNMLWLDYDYIFHDIGGREMQPEIITVLGFKDSVLSLQINNYSNGPLTEEVTVEIFDNAFNLQKKYAIPPSFLSGRKSYWVCDVHLSTGAIVEVLKPIASIGTFN